MVPLGKIACILCLPMFAFHYCQDDMCTALHSRIQLGASDCIYRSLSLRTLATTCGGGGQIVNANSIWGSGVSKRLGYVLHSSQSPSSESEEVQANTNNSSESELVEVNQSRLVPLNLSKSRLALPGGCNFAGPRSGRIEAVRSAAENSSMCIYIYSYMHHL